MNKTNGSNILKLLGGILLIILGLWIIHAIFFNSNPGLNIVVRGGDGGDHFNMGLGMGYGVGTSGTISFILLLMIKVLFVLFILGLIVGIGIVIKRYVFTESDVQQIKGAFTGKKTVVIKETCTICGKELNDDWKVCPHCGKEKETIIN